MKMQKDPKEKCILTRLEEAGYEAYFVGGWVRDQVMEQMMGPQAAGEKPAGDVDVTTNALPEQIKEVFSHWRVLDTGLKHGTVTVLLPEARRPIPVEITTFRRDGDYSDGRHPDGVEFVSALEEDLARRDFTINAMAVDCRGAVRDPFGGTEDIRKRRLRTVGDPNRRFQEDGLRIMRAMRFAAVLGFSIEPETERALLQNKELLRHISVERIFAELKKLVTGPCGGEVIRRYVDVLGVFMPELLAMKGFLQNNPYHKYDVLEHCVRSMEAVRTGPENREYMKLAALFHDMGKPETYSVDAQGVGHFYRHPAGSCRKAEEILKRLKADHFTIQRVALLTKYHDLVFQKDPALLKRWMNRFTPAVLLELLEIKRADNFATGNMSRELAEKFDEIQCMIQRIIEEGQCFQLKDLAVTGADILALGIRPGPQVGEILDRLLEEVVAGRLENRWEALMELAESLKK